MDKGGKGMPQPHAGNCTGTDRTYSYFVLHKFVTYSLRHLPIYLQPRTYTGQINGVEESLSYYLVLLLF